MLPEEELRRVARDFSTRYILTLLYRDLYVVSGMSGADVVEKHRNIREGLKRETFPGAPAELSDLLASEIEASVDQFLTGLEEVMAGLPPR